MAEKGGRYQASIQTSLKILKMLAQKRECAQYDMPKLIGKDYHTCLRHLRELENDGLVKLVRVEPAKKGGKDRKIYTLTLYGLLVALFSLLEEKPEPHEKMVKADVDPIIDTWKDYHFIFKFWQEIYEASSFDPYLVLYGVTSEFYENWQRSSFDMFNWKYKTLDVAVWFSRSFFDAFFEISKDFSQKTLREWVAIIKNNKELKSVYIREFNRIISRKQQELTFFKNLVEKLQNHF